MLNLVEFEEIMSLICPLFSGSSGNSIYIEEDGFSFLIDAGRSAKQIESCLMKNTLQTNVNFILLTHEHSDHTSGLRVFAKRRKAKIYGSRGTIEALEEKGILDSELDYSIIDTSGFENDKIKVVPFEISHDCAQGFGYSIATKKSKIKFSLCSDLGYLSDDVFNAISDSDILFIESNHDVEMLKNGPYPQVLKNRIMSNKGHLSNESCAETILKLLHRNLSKAVLCHLSSTNNTPELAHSCVMSHLEKSGIDYSKNFNLYVSPKVNFNQIKIQL